MLRPAVVLLVLLAAACGREEGQGAPPETPASAAAVPASGADAAPASVAASQAPPAGALGPDVYVGRWAAQPGLCAAGAWTFAADRLTTAGEVSCRFNEVERTSSGWEIDARCTAEGPAEDTTLTLTLTDPAPPEAMTVSGGPFQSLTLRRCP